MRSAEEGMKEEVKEAGQRMVEKIDEKLRLMISNVQEMMKEMMKGFFGEGADGGRSTGSCDGPGAVKEVEERMDENMSDKGDLIVISKGNKGKRQDKDKPKDKNKKGSEEKKKTKGKKASKDDRQDESRTEYVGERAESDLDSGEWKQVGKKKKGKMSIIKSIDVFMEVDSLYSEEVKRDRDESSKSGSESEQEVRKAVYMREVPQCAR
ncbi:uncharacterized protein LOC135203910 [Macrobrachium nipponense]|uniref:uncharacterized protein LOC135203910 n=1 Tax=Macrobrachium nipponense TaxID=159736 RepID=UPI0030C7EAD1